MIKIIKLSVFVLFGMFLYTQVFAKTAPCCKNGVLVDTCAHPGYDDKGRELAYDLSSCTKPAQVVCANENEVYVNGKCVPLVIVSCPAGQILLNGNCVPIAIVDEPFCLTGSTYNPVTKQCEYTCEDGTKVTSLANCPVKLAVICWDGSSAASLDLCPKKECETGRTQYQPCDKNGVNCGTQERTCLNNKWTVWSACRIL